MNKVGYLITPFVLASGTICAEPNKTELVLYPENSSLITCNDDLSGHSQKDIWRHSRSATVSVNIIDFVKGEGNMMPHPIYGIGSGSVIDPIKGTVTFGRIINEDIGSKEIKLVLSDAATNKDHRVEVSLVMKQAI